MKRHQAVKTLHSALFDFKANFKKMGILVYIFPDPIFSTALSQYGSVLRVVKSFAVFKMFGCASCMQKKKIPIHI